ncbi:MAG: DUF2007 domain-containing protein [Gammaproteobacteria bacterium]|nr:DUF2007 domain-containing protein [Gammaproteobacteria bacterium]MDH3535273.1 DUF2007 domain-containing protein [Gammaproteobacteria bacterium]
MKKVFTHENRMIVFNMKNVLQEQGIDTVVVNEFAAGGAGDLPAFDTWPEIWVKDDSKLQRAQAILQAILNSNADRAWVCRQCHERNHAAFELCWNCGRASE